MGRVRGSNLHWDSHLLRLFRTRSSQQLVLIVQLVANVLVTLALGQALHGYHQLAGSAVW